MFAMEKKKVHKKENFQLYNSDKKSQEVKQYNNRTIQRYKIPASMNTHLEECAAIKNRIENLGGEQTTYLGVQIKGAETWARETRLAALRKYNEMHDAIGRSEEKGKYYSMGTDTTTQPDVFSDDEYIEIKTVSGEVGQITENIHGARKQLAERVPIGKEGLAIIHIEECAWIELAEKSGGLFSPTIFDNIKTYLTKSVKRFSKIKSKGSRYTLKILYGTIILLEYDITDKHPN